jgi:ParB-like chromosome segregation protein Spo0J
MQHPIDNIEWIEADLLQANDYNPNVVFSHELKLLEHSILTNGWIQPILVTHDLIVIDGFHRFMLGKTSPKVRALTDGKIPVVKMELTEPERKMLTIRINRAKGVHAAVKMSEIVKSLIDEHFLSVDQVCEGIGATKDEVDLLMMDNVFKAFDTPNHKYSKAWYPA